MNGDITVNVDIVPYSIRGVEAIPIVYPRNSESWEGCATTRSPRCVMITSGSTVGLRGVKSALSEAFSMKNIGMIRQFIGLEVNKKASGIMITQSIYIGYFLKIFHMIDCKATSVMSPFK